jgi:hypothetical protein
VELRTNAVGMGAARGPPQVVQGVGRLVPLMTA